MIRKKGFLLLFLVILTLTLVACESDNNAVDDGKINLPFGSNDYEDMKYQEAVSTLEQAGFTNVETIILDDLVTGWLTENGEIEEISINGDDIFSEDDRIAPDTKIVVTYHTFAEDESENSEAEKLSENSVVDKDEKDSAPEDILTEKNNPDLSAVLLANGEINPIYSEFVSKYEGAIIEFDGHIDYVANHENYTTRWDILLSYGDWVNENTTSTGPIFKFEDVGLSNLGIKDLYLPEFVSVGSNVCIKAEVESYDENSGMFILKPILLKQR